MNVSEALNTRLTVRAFLDKPVEARLIREILETAKRAPSGGNLQPWHVWVVAGDELARFKALIREKMSANPRGEGTEYHIYPPELKEPYKSRRFKVGEDMYATIGVSRDDKMGRLMQFARNFEFFGAPCALFFAIDRQMQQGQWADLACSCSRSCCWRASTGCIRRHRRLGRSGTRPWASSCLSRLT